MVKNASLDQMGSWEGDILFLGTVQSTVTLHNCLDLPLPKGLFLTPLGRSSVLENTLKTTAWFVVFPCHKFNIHFLIHHQTWLRTWRLFVEAAALKMPPVMLRIVGWSYFSDVGFWIGATEVKAVFVRSSRESDKATNRSVRTCGGWWPGTPRENKGRD